MVLLSTQNICWNRWARKYLQFYAQKCCLSTPVHKYLHKGNMGLGLLQTNNKNTEQPVHPCSTFVFTFLIAYTVNPLYNDTVCFKLSLTLNWICCYKEILTITRFQQNNHLVKEKVVQMNQNAIIPNVYISLYSYCIKNAQSFPLIKWDRHLFMQNTLVWSQNCLTHGNNSVIMNLFSIEIVYLFPEVTVGVVKWIFCYKEGILMETDPSVPSSFMLDIEYSVIKSDVIKSFDCNVIKSCCVQNYNLLSSLCN